MVAIRVNRPFHDFRLRRGYRKVSWWGGAYGSKEIWRGSLPEASFRGPNILKTVGVKKIINLDSKMSVNSS
jgi:Zn-dependent M16 (insulinase) family peptidase